jgi:hypothetical protein
MGCLKGSGVPVLYIGRTVPKWGSQTVHCVGSAEERMKPLPIFFVDVKSWLHLGMCI